MKYADSVGGDVNTLDGHFKGNEEQQLQIVDQLKDLHGELIAAEHFALKLILSAQIRKSARSADQSSSEVALPQQLILQDRTEDGSPGEQRPELRHDICRPLAIDPAEPFTGVHLFWEGKKRSNTKPDKMTEGALMAFSGITEVSGPLLSQLFLLKKTQIVSSWTDCTTKIPSRLIVKPVNPFSSANNVNSLILSFKTLFSKSNQDRSGEHGCYRCGCRLSAEPLRCDGESSTH